jgi:hypothetical protein
MLEGHKTQKKKNKAIKIIGNLPKCNINYYNSFFSVNFFLMLVPLSLI